VRVGGGGGSAGKSQSLCWGVWCIFRFSGCCYGICIRVKTFYCIDVWLFVICIRFLVWQFCNVGGVGGRRG